MKVSIDGKTIIEMPPAGNILLQRFKMFILGQIPGSKEIILDTFTEFDLAIGMSKRLIVLMHGRRRKSVYVYAGKDLKEEDLTAEYDSFGSRI